MMNGIKEDSTKTKLILHAMFLLNLEIRLMTENKFHAY